MDSDRWKQIDNILQAALDQPPGKRADFLQLACKGDEALEIEVRSLLASQEEAGSFWKARRWKWPHRNSPADKAKRSQTEAIPLWARSFLTTASSRSSAVAGWVWFIRPRTPAFIASSL